RLADLRFEAADCQCALQRSASGVVGLPGPVCEGATLVNSDHPRAPGESCRRAERNVHECDAPKIFREIGPWDSRCQASRTFFLVRGAANSGTRLACGSCFSTSCVRSSGLSCFLRWSSHWSSG